MESMGRLGRCLLRRQERGGVAVCVSNEPDASIMAAPNWARRGLSMLEEGVVAKLIKSGEIMRKDNDVV